VSAADVLTTVSIASELGTAGGYWQSITAEEGDDAGTVRLSTSRALANLPTMLGSLPLLSATQFAGLSAAQIPDSDAAKSPQGTGPYRITSISSGGAGLVRRTDLLATDQAALAEAGTSAEKIALYFFPDAASALSGWSASSLDQLVGLDIADASPAEGLHFHESLVDTDKSSEQKWPTHSPSFEEEIKSYRLRCVHNSFSE
jgi:ABC-type transport system substrate-binding protein